MKTLSIVFLFVFCSLVSGFSNGQFFYNFAINASMSIVFLVAVGICFDIAKLVASTQITTHVNKAPFLALGWLLVWLVCASVSLFCAVGLVDSGAESIKSSGSLLTVYKKQVDIQEANKIIFEHKIKDHEDKKVILSKRELKQAKSDLAYTNNLLKSALKKYEAELKNPTSTKATTNSLLIEYSRYFGLGVASLIELIGFVCGLTIGANSTTDSTTKTAEKTAKNSTTRSTTDSTTSQLLQGTTANIDSTTASTNHSATDDTNSTIKSLQIDELALYLIAKNEADLSYGQLHDKYELSAPKISKVKKYIMAMNEPKEQEQPKQIKTGLSLVKA